MANNTQAVTLYIPRGAEVLADNQQWTNRFTIHSGSSDREYTIAQHKSNRYWGCSCPGWKRWKRCHHLEEMGIPGDLQPYEVQLKEG